ncbi:type IV pili methyl-accepting chemotaxis transducer N-terminal domain-containing protein [Tabrizicola sp.]|uniref:type IV pili methyl-accepting chemotaxis transducer N-terminal domain-containing protein n=1 Tax=Tabrizicola sp. TaxID=2005166 RepID=UPI003F3DFF26
MNMPNRLAALSALAIVAAFAVQTSASAQAIRSSGAGQHTTSRPTGDEYAGLVQLTEGNRFLEDVGGSARIALAGKLRMLSQRIASSACHYAADVATDKSLDTLLKAKAEYNSILTALTDGDESLGIIGAESQRRTLEAIQAVRDQWTPYEAALDAIVAGTDVEANFAHVAQSNLALLNLANVLTSEVSAEYSNPAEMTQAQALAVDISARQRMLSQRIAKEACGVVIGNADLGTAEQLAKTMGLYETSLNALLNGMPEAGIEPPPNDELREKLAAAAADWGQTKALLQAVIGEGQASKEGLGQVYLLMDEELARMIDIAKQYAESAKPKI